MGENGELTACGKCANFSIWIYWYLGPEMVRECDAPVCFEQNQVFSPVTGEWRTDSQRVKNIRDLNVDGHCPAFVPGIPKRDTSLTDENLQPRPPKARRGFWRRLVACKGETNRA